MKQPNFRGLTAFFNRLHMKIVTHKMWKRRKTFIIFLLGFFVPSLIILYLSWNSFSKRREALKQVLESQIWISGKTAVESIESALQEYEESILRQENFTLLYNLDERNNALERDSSFPAEKTFVLDSDFKLLFPRGGSDSIPYVRLEERASDSPFYYLFKRAEYLEFEKRHYAEAAELYRQCCAATPVKQLQAVSMERCGRCLYRADNLDEAYCVYRKLLNDYGEYDNRVGLPYGLITPLYLHNIARYQTVELELLKTLVDTFKNLRSGEWSVDNSTYDYYSKEIQDILNKELSEEKYPELFDTVQDLLSSSSPYLEELKFRKLLTENVIPILKDRSAFSRFAEEPSRGRFPVICDEVPFLVSFYRFRDVSSSNPYYAGFCWDLDYIKNQKLPEIAEDLARSSGIQVRFIGDESTEELSHQESVIPKNSLIVNFSQFPLPWRLLVTLTSLENLKSTAQRENLLHGILLVLIVGLMGMGTFFIFRDIARESEAARHKSEFVHNISHELKTPLTLIRLYGETLKDKRIHSEKNRREAYEIITKESERLSHLINNVLDFSRIETGRKEFFFKKEDLAMIIKETLDSYRYHSEKKGFKIHEEIDANLPPMDFDREAITSVLINLLSNAMKFSREKKELFVRLFRDENNAVLQVEDKGIGISQKEVDKIFQRFYRSDNKVVSESRGSGLGLTIIQHIAEAHGGRVEVESEIGVGSIFSIMFPFSKTDEDKK